ncbi:salivary glue protein Sgs-7-like [Drosophila obscura]|uniref:salivary glue protein Sgs-7-like n=1 Tax=Drosophila obscura TaxID=7282 RepID=UPI001BB1AC3C|nr:salivary glue protein Sgs-7-like [Drosophila obscura]
MKLTIFIVASILLISFADLGTGCKTPNNKPPKGKPPTNPCDLCGLCGPGGTACQGCKGRDGLCQELLDNVRVLERKIRQCVCGEKSWLL